MSTPLSRRAFVGLTVAASALPFVATASTTAYAPGVIEQALARGETVFVGYSADWCSTCARQERIMAKLRAENPAYDAAMTFVRVDWDDFKNHAVAKSRGIPRRSTLIVLRADQELGRVVAGTSEAQIKTLMDTGL